MTDDVGRSRVAPFIALGIAVVMVGLIVLLVGADPDRNAPTAESPLLGKPAPEAVGELSDGTPFDLSRRKGSWVVINFFQSDCIPCIQEHPELIAFVDQQRALGNDGAEFYSVVRDSTRAEVAEFFAERGGDWPIVFDDRYEFVNGFGVALVPETWIVDPNGFVRRRFISEVTADGLSGLMQALREGVA